MKQKTLPQTREELKELIVETVREVNEKNIPEMSEDEMKEIEALHGDTLDKPRNPEEYEPL